MHIINKLQNMVKHFSVQGRVVNIEPINKGYINCTYKVETLSDNGNIHQYILQRINTNVFPDVDALMHNFQLTTEHLSQCLQMP